MIQTSFVKASVTFDRLGAFHLDLWALWHVNALPWLSYHCREVYGTGSQLDRIPPGCVFQIFGCSFYTLVRRRPDHLAFHLFFFRPIFISCQILSPDGSIRHSHLSWWRFVQIILTSALSFLHRSSRGFYSCEQIGRPWLFSCVGPNPSCPHSIFWLHWWSVPNWVTVPCRGLTNSNRMNCQCLPPDRSNHRVSNCAGPDSTLQSHRAIWRPQTRALQNAWSDLSR